MSSMQPLNTAKMMLTTPMYMTSLQKLMEKMKTTQTTNTMIQNKTMTMTKEKKKRMTTTTTMMTEMTHQK